MRLWTIHPAYLDARGLTAAWREGLLAQKVLAGKTKGYRHHPQLDRFKKAGDPMKAIGRFLTEIRSEAAKRGYNFNGEKITDKTGSGDVIRVSEGQVEYEWKLLRKKVRGRDSGKYREIRGVRAPELNPIFWKKKGGIEEWEKVGRPGRKTADRASGPHRPL